MNNNLFYLLEFAGRIGTINQMLCYDSGFCSVEGKTSDGKKFDITLHIKEEEKDGN